MQSIRTCLLIAALISIAACSRQQDATANYPTVRGVVQEVRTEQGTLLVKHEDIPGVMPAMTMPFRANADILKSATKDQAFTALLVRRPDGLWLEEYKGLPPAPSK